MNDAYFWRLEGDAPSQAQPIADIPFKIVRNLSFNAIGRKEQRRETATIPLPCRRLILACVAAPNAVEDVIEARELAHILEGFLDTLTKEKPGHFPAAVLVL